MKRPSIGILVALIFGILISHLIEVAFIFYAVLIAIFVATLVLNFLFSNAKFKLPFSGNQYSLIISGTIVLIGLGVGLFHQSNLNDLAKLHDANYEFLFQGKITSFPKEKSNGSSFEFDVDKVHQLNAEAIDFNGKLFTKIYGKNSKWNYGDVVLIKSAIKKVENNGNPGEFNFKSYLNNKGIDYAIYANSEEVVKIENGNNFVIDGALKIRSYCMRQIEASFSAEAAPLTKAILLGYKNDLSEETRADFAASGASHILAVSGMHVGIVVVLLNFILIRWIRNKRVQQLARIFAVFIILGYVFVTGFSPSILRAGLMFSLMVFGGVFRKDSNALNHVATSAIILLLFNPYFLFDLGFQLSYLAVFGILLLHKRIYNLLFFKFKPLDYLWKLTAVSLSAQIATFPLTIFYFHQFPTLFLLTNPVVSIFAVIILFSGIFFLLFVWFAPLANFFAYCCEWAINLLGAFTNWINQLSFSLITGIQIQFWHVLMLFLTVAFAIALNFRKKSNRYLFATFCMCLISVFVLVSNWSNEQNDELIVFNSRKSLVVNINAENRHAYAILGKTDQKYEQNILDSYWSSLDVQEKLELKDGFQGESIWFNKGLLLLDGKKILFLTNENKYMLQKTHFDFVVMAEKIYRFDSGLGAGVWVIPQHISIKNESQAMKILYQNQQKVYRAKTEGAFRLPLNNL